MGCILGEEEFSLVETAEVAKDGAPRRIRNNNFREVRRRGTSGFFSGPALREDQLQSIWAAAQVDDVTSFAKAIESYDPSIYNSEACNPGTCWTMGMLCARWGAYSSLKFYLHHVYTKFGEDEYRAMMAVQEAQQLDLLKIAALFRNQGIVDLVLSFGGSPLNLTDKLGRDSIRVLALNGYQDQALSLLKLQNQGIEVVPLNAKLITVLPKGNLSNDKINQYLENKRKQDQRRATELQRQGQDEQARRLQEQARAKREAEKQAMLDKMKREQAMREEQERLKAQEERRKNQIAQQGDYPVSEFSAQMQQTLIACFKTKTNWKDPSFPPVPTSITTDPRVSEGIRQAIFVRVTDLFPRGGAVLFDKIAPEDIMQGELGICYYLSTLASLAEKPDRIRKLFKTSSLSEVGAYCLNFFVHGKLTDIYVDDYVPVGKGTMQPIFTRPVGNEVWTLLLEKAWVKNFGSYTAAEGMAPEEMMGDLCGAPSEGFWINKTDPDKLFKMLLDYDNKGYLMILSSSASSKLKGMVAGHAYSLLGVFDLAGVRLYKIRNPWGSFEYSGKFGDKSGGWTSELKAAVKFEDKDDGIFFMTPEELGLGFDYVSVCFYSDSAFRTETPVTSKPGQDLFFSFELKQQGLLSIELCQLNDRYLRDKTYKYSPCEFQVFGGKAFFGGDDQGTIFGAKYTHLSNNVQQVFAPGKYYVRLRVNWVGKYNEAVLVPYSLEKVTLAPADPAVARKVWIECVSAACLAEESQDLGSGLLLYSKWFGNYIGYVLKNSTKGSLTPQIQFAKEQMSNVRPGVNMEGGFKVSPSLGGGDSFLFTFQKLVPNAETTVGGFSYRL